MVEVRERIRTKWIYNRNEMWRTMISKIDREDDPKRFWVEIKRMMGRGKKVGVETFKSENCDEVI